MILNALKLSYTIIFILIFLPLSILWCYTLFAIPVALQQLLVDGLDYGDIILLLLSPVSGFSIFCAYFASFKLITNQSPVFYIHPLYHLGVLIGCTLSLYFACVINWFFIFPFSVMALFYLGVYLQNVYLIKP